MGYLEYMKLIIFLDSKDTLSEKENKIINGILGGNLYSKLPQEIKDTISEDEQSTINNLFVERVTKSKSIKPMFFNYYKIVETPTVLFLNDSEVVYRWDKIPDLSDIIKSVISYFRILKLNSLDYNYDPEE
jgi:hypothetical protein